MSDYQITIRRDLAYAFLGHFGGYEATIEHGIRIHIEWGFTLWGIKQKIKRRIAVEQMNQIVETITEDELFHE